MHQRIHIGLATATLAMFLAERGVEWSEPSLKGQFRILFFILFFIQAAFPAYWLFREPDRQLEAIPGVLLFLCIAAAGLAVWLYDIPIACLNLIVRLAAPIFG